MFSYSKKKPQNVNSIDLPVTGLLLLYGHSKSFQYAVVYCKYDFSLFHQVLVIIWQFYCSINL